jgi:hypothetical protein
MDTCGRARKGISKPHQSPVAADELVLRNRERTAELSSGLAVLAERDEGYAQCRSRVDRRRMVPHPEPIQDEGRR